MERTAAAISRHVNYFLILLALVGYDNAEITNRIKLRLKRTKYKNNYIEKQRNEQITETNKMKISTIITTKSNTKKK